MIVNCIFASFDDAECFVYYIKTKVDISVRGFQKARRDTANSRIPPGRSFSDRGKSV